MPIVYAPDAYGGASGGGQKPADRPLPFSSNGESLDIRYERLPGMEVLYAGERIDLIAATEGITDDIRRVEAVSELSGLTEREIYFILKPPPVVGSKGFLRFEEITVEGEGGLHLVNEGVPRQHRGKGFARQLHQRFEEIARERGMAFLEESVHEGNAYVRKVATDELGYSEVGVTNGTVTLRKRLR